MKSFLQKKISWVARTSRGSLIAVDTFTTNGAVVKLPHLTEQ